MLRTFLVKERHLQVTIYMECECIPSSNIYREPAMYLTWVYSSEPKKRNCYLVQYLE